jgi:hypothetical protein
LLLGVNCVYYGLKESIPSTVENLLTSGSYLCNHGYENQSKLLGTIPSAVRDCSTFQFHYASLLELEFH